MAYRLFIPWALITAVIVLIILIVLGVAAVNRKRKRTETAGDIGYDRSSFYNSPPYSGEVPRNYCPYCGIRLYKGSSYCANCGRSVD